MKRKTLSLILVFAMTVSLLTVGTGAVEPTYGDTAGHWAESSIERWSGHGIIQGSNNEFDPNSQLTCAQLATILARLLKLPAGPDAGFSDVAADAWYADAINRCVAAGILNGNGDGTVSPTAPITRERAMVMLGRALGIQPVENPDLSKHSDAAKVSDYAQGIVAAMIEAGIVTGVGGDQIAPKDDINRASTVTILDRAISAYADQAGETIKGDGKGIILVVAENVTITGDVDTLLVVAPDATVTLDGANAKNVSVNGEDSKLVLNNSEVENVSVSGANTEVETKGSSKVENVSVAEDAKGSTVNAGSGTTIGTVDSKADNVSISGDGKVDNASVSGDNTKVDTKDTKVDVAEGVTGTTAGGKDVAGGTTAETPATPSTPSGGGSSSGGSSGSTHTHDYKTGTVTKAPTCTEKGEKKLTCSCGASKTEEIPALGHDWNDGEITKAATCTEKGEKTVTCKRTDCDASETHEIPATGHQHTTDVDAKAATCTECGWDAYTICNDCDVVTVGSNATIPAAGHSWDDGAVTTEPGYGITGKRTFTCKACGETKIEDIAALEHHMKDVEGKAPTCTEGGWTAYQICEDTDCNLIQNRKKLPAKGHTEVVDEAVAATCTTDGKTEGKHCSVCGEVIVAQTVISATGHSWNSGEVTTEPSCSTEGERTFKCNNCGATQTETIAKSEHEFDDDLKCKKCGEYKDTVVATIGTKGYESLIAAYEALPRNASSTTTIKLIKDSAGGGFGSDGDVGMKYIIDFNGHTYTVGEPAVGSTGTVTQGVRVLKGSTAEFKNGTLKAANYEKLKQVVHTYGTVTFTDFVVDVTEDTYASVAVEADCGKLTIYGSSSILAREGKIGLYVAFWHTKNYTGTNVIVDTTGKITGALVYEFDESYPEDPAKFNKCYLTIKNGIFEISEIKTLFTNVTDEKLKEVKISIYGGTFTVDPRAYVGSEYVVVKNEETGVWSMLDVAENVTTGVKYTSLATAISKTTNGDTIKLIANTYTPEKSYSVNSTKTLTLDLNGKTLTGSGKDGVIHSSGKGMVTITGKGKIVAVEDGKYAMAVWAEGASKVIINSSEFTQCITGDSSQYDMIYASGKATIEINGGSFESKTPKWTLNILDKSYTEGTANIVVSGGTFYVYDPANSDTESPKANFVKNGYKSVETEDGVWTVSAVTEVEAAAEINEV